MPKTVLTKKQIAFIRNNYRKMSGADIDIKFHVSKGCSKRYMKNNGLKVSKKLSIKFRTEKLRGKTTSTRAVDKYLRKNYLLLPVNRMAININRSETFVKTRMRQLHLVTPRRIINQFIKSSQIKKGHVPENKGKKQADYMSAEMIERTKATRFKKGQTPHNAVGFNDGDIVVRQRTDRNMPAHKYIRLALGKWQELQIHNWEKENGPVPKGFVLACINGDTLNCNPSNWKLMSMEDNMRRNSASLNLTDNYVAMCITGRKNMHLMPAILENNELIQAKRTTLLLNRKIKQHEKQAV